MAALQGRAAEVQRHLRWLFSREDGARDDRLRLWQHHMTICGLRMSDTLGGPDRAAAPAEGDEPLSARQREALQCLAAGDSNKLIARALDISPHPVKRHLANIPDRLPLSSRGQAAAWWRKNG